MSAVDVATRASNIARQRAVKKHGTEDLKGDVKIIGPADLTIAPVGSFHSFGGDHMATA